MVGPLGGESVDPLGGWGGVGGNMYVCIYIYICLCMYIYIYHLYSYYILYDAVYDLHIFIYTHTYIYICIHTHHITQRTASVIDSVIYLSVSICWLR